MLTAREVVEPYVVEQSAVIASSAPRVRADLPDAVHATRVATRRLRSALATFAPLWTTRHRALRRELRWYAGVLGRARDLEVAGEWLVTLCTTTMAGDLGASAAQEVMRRVDADRTAAMTLLRVELDGPRFDQLVAMLPPVKWSILSGVPAEQVVVGLASAPGLVVAEEARTLPPGPTRPVALHELRKSAKAARYGVDALGPGAAVHAALWKRVTESLGVAQDAWVARGVLDELDVEEPDHHAVWKAVRRAVDLAAADAETLGLDLVREAATTPSLRDAAVGGLQ